MRTITIIVAFIMTAGCATSIPMSYQDYCAARGLKFVGVDSYSGGTVAFVEGRTGSAISSGETIKCVPAQTKEEQCQINQLNEIDYPKRDFNSNVTTYGVLTGIGYVLYIAPGLVMWAIAAASKSDAIDESLKIADKDKNMCTETAPTSVPIKTSDLK